VGRVIPRPLNPKEKVSIEKEAERAAMLVWTFSVEEIVLLLP
jgi:hypothetical protein